ncbi:hypothetical protein DUI87_33079 [Hirundo rustica rustica]|uniref:Transmembrane protein 223 n=1 Tax=Hirundo rustica rustica TaxID=333673 RepID=A0A3M0IQ12_HIRRU|nr:hypothetical protein DUI87_33079 [Hirundo rustica rustica]
MAARAALEVAAVSRDVVLYQHDRSRFFRLVGLFCTGQGLFWAYLAHFAFTALRPAPGPGPDDPLRPRDNKWRFGFTASCLTVGTGGAGPGSERERGGTGDSPGLEPGRGSGDTAGSGEGHRGSGRWNRDRTGLRAADPAPAHGVTPGTQRARAGPGARPAPPQRCPSPPGSLTLAAGCVLPLRSVSRVTLLRGGSAVTIGTPGPLGLGRRSLTVPLRDVSGRAHRLEVRAAVPIKVRGRPFFFLLDKNGSFSDPRLFDITVGALRKF